MSTIESSRQEFASQPLLSIKLSELPEVATGIFRTIVSPPPNSEPLARDARIAIAAYYLSQRRRFVPTGALADWLAAEREIDTVRLPDE